MSGSDAAVFRGSDSPSVPRSEAWGDVMSYDIMEPHKAVMAMYTGDVLNSLWLVDDVK